MTTLTINIPDCKEGEVSQFVEQLGGEVVEVRQGTVLDRIREGLCEAKAIREGRIKGLTLADVLGD
jgi:hypothetical protein